MKLTYAQPSHFQALLNIRKEFNSDFKTASIVWLPEPKSDSTRWYYASIQFKNSTEHEHIIVQTINPLNSIILPLATAWIERAEKEYLSKYPNRVTAKVLNEVIGI